MDWLGKLLDLPEAFLSTSGTGGGGVIQGRRPNPGPAPAAEMRS